LCQGCIGSENDVDGDFNQRCVGKALCESHLPIGIYQSKWETGLLALLKYKFRELCTCWVTVLLHCPNSVIRTRHAPIHAGIVTSFRKCDQVIMIVHLLLRTWGKICSILNYSLHWLIPTLKRLRSVALRLKPVYIQVLACIENNHGSDG